MRKLVAWTLWRALAAAAFCMAVGWIALSTVGIRGTGRTSPVLAHLPFLDMWIRWDAGWYQAIATVGYSFTPNIQSSVAFFPVYPLLMRGLIALGANVFVAGMIVTWSFGLCGLALFAIWAKQLAGEEAARLATLLLIVWPFALYLYGAVYSDALYLALAVGAFLLLERGHPGWAALLGAVATAERPVGVALSLGLLVRAIELRARAKEKLRAWDLVPALSGLGLAGYMGFLWWRFGDPLVFLEAQKGWGQLSGFDALVKRVLWDKPIDDWAMALPQGAAALGLLALAWPMRRLLGWGYSAYIAVVIGIPILTSRNFIGLGRYAIAGFPSILVLALLLRERPRVRRAWVAVSVLGLAFMSYRMAIGFYVS